MAEGRTSPSCPFSLLLWKFWLFSHNYRADKMRGKMAFETWKFNIRNVMRRHKCSCLKRFAELRTQGCCTAPAQGEWREQKEQAVGRQSRDRLRFFLLKIQYSFIHYTFFMKSRIKKKRLQWNMGLPACSRISQKPLFSFPWSQAKHVFSGSIFSSLKQKLSLLCVPTVPSAIGLLSQQGLLSATVIKLINHNF